MKNISNFPAFQIRESYKLLAIEDMWSVLDLTAKDKNTGTIERIARAVRALSSDPEKDTRLLLQRLKMVIDAIEVLAPCRHSATAQILNDVTSL
ncbi:MAG: hypothetical protein Q7V56_10225 [Gammaproteobacteria bacterium]|nr:hypothetical protein [Gammaproteobacteria bacterium]